MNRITPFFILPLLVSCMSDPLVRESDDSVMKSVLSTASLQVLDGDGLPVNQIGPDFCSYRIAVDCEGAWKIDSLDSFVSLETLRGIGPDTISLLVSENWWGSRMCTLDFSPYEGDSETLVLVQQESNSIPENMSKLSAVRGAGFAYTPDMNLAKGVGGQVFNVDELRMIQQETGIQLFADDYYPQNSVTVYSSDSIEGIERQIAVSVGVEVGIYMVTVGIKGEFSSSSETDGNSEFGYMNLRRSYFTREIQYGNALSLAISDASMYRRIFAPGFRRELEQFIDNVKYFKTDAVRMELCRDFVKMTGLGFIQKSVLGCSMEYSISVNKSYLTDSVTIGGTISASFGEEFSLASMEGSGSYSQAEKEAARNSQSSITIRGGDTGEVGIVSAGGNVDYPTLQKWQLSVTPDNAVLIDANVLPLYYIIPDVEVRSILENYYNTYLKKEAQE